MTTFEKHLNHYKMKTLQKNKYGQVDCTKEIPNGFVQTTLDCRTLKKLKIQYHKGFFGYSGRYPEIHNIISRTDEKRIQKCSIQIHPIFSINYYFTSQEQKKTFQDKLGNNKHQSIGDFKAFADKCYAQSIK